MFLKYFFYKWIKIKFMNEVNRTGFYILRKFNLARYSELFKN